MPRKKQELEENIEGAPLEESAPASGELLETEKPPKPVKLPPVKAETAPLSEPPPDAPAFDSTENTDVTSEAAASVPESFPAAEIPVTETALSETPVAEMPTPETTAANVRRKSFYDLDVNRLDRNLSPEEAQEWNSIYASYRSKSILSGVVIGVDENRFEVKDNETGKISVKTINSLIVVNYRVKILLPETELWMPGEERPMFVARSMVGGAVDFVILDVDREGECAIASRRLALMSRRYFFGRTAHNIGDRLTCRVVSAGPKLCLVECNGFDLTLSPRDLTYSAVPDLREKFRPGMELGCILKRYDKDTPELAVSVKEAAPNPFDGADKRHPVGSRRQAVISGKYKGGVFCTLPDGTVCHCLYASRYADANFRIGDSVIIAIREFNYQKQQMFGRIIGKW